MLFARSLPFTTTPNSHRRLQDWDCAESLDLPFLERALRHFHVHGCLPLDLQSKEDRNGHISHDAKAKMSGLRKRCKEEITERMLLGCGRATAANSLETQVAERTCEGHSGDSLSKTMKTSENPGSFDVDVKINLCVLEGFLLYADPSLASNNRQDLEPSDSTTAAAAAPAASIQKSVTSYITPSLKLFLRSTLSLVRSRREARKGCYAITTAASSSRKAEENYDSCSSSISPETATATTSAAKPCQPESFTSTPTSITNPHSTTRSQYSALNSNVDSTPSSNSAPESSQQSDFWFDPPGYIDEVVWPNYVRDHVWMFVNGDVEGGRPVWEKAQEEEGKKITGNERVAKDESVQLEEAVYGDCRQQEQSQENPDRHPLPTMVANNITTTITQPTKETVKEEEARTTGPGIETANTKNENIKISPGFGQLGLASLLEWAVNILKEGLEDEVIKVVSCQTDPKDQ